MKKNVWENLLFAGAFFEKPVRDEEGIFDYKYLKDIIKVIDTETDAKLAYALDESEDSFAKKEFDMLNTNITFVHPLLQDAHLYNPLDSITEGMTGRCMLKVESTKEKKSKNGNMYKHLKVTCMNSFETTFIFCFDLTINFKKGEIYILPIKNNNGFISVDIYNKR